MSNRGYGSRKNNPEFERTVGPNGGVGYRRKNKAVGDAERSRLGDPVSSSLEDDVMNTQDTLEKYLVGRRIASADGDTLTLDGGTTLQLYESAQDCCAGASGEWKILDPDRLEAAITDVEYESRAYEDGDTRQETCRITILHNQNPIALSEGYADAGNGGYYFSALALKVTVDGSTVHDDDIISA